MSLRTAERILRRALVIEDLDAIDHEGLYAVVTRVAGPAYAELSGKHYGHARTSESPKSATNALVALGLLRRRAGLEPRLLGLLPDPEEAPRSLGHYWYLLLRAVSQEAEAMRALESGRYASSRTTSQYHSWGLHVGLAGDAVDREAARLTAKRMILERNEARAVEFLKQFEIGIEQGSGMAVGVAPHLDPDEETRMGADWIGREESLQVKRTDSVESLAAYESEATRGMLHFSTGEALTTGVVRSADIRAALIGTQRGNRYLNLPLPEASELRVGFEVIDELLVQDWELLISHQVAKRDSLPYAGEGALEVLLDGVLVHRGQLEFIRGARHSLTVVVPGELLTPGLHELVVRPHRSTNSTTWVHWLVLREVPKKK